MISVNGVEVRDRAGAVHELLRQRALLRGLVTAAGDAVTTAAGIERLLASEVAVPEPEVDACRRYYATHGSGFSAGELVFARHILFAVTPGVPVTALAHKAESTLFELRQDATRFPVLAQTLSNCPSGQHGGNLGQLGRGDSVPEFEQALFDEPTVGLLPQLVKTRYGFHIVMIDRRVPGQILPFEIVHQHIRLYLATAVQQVALSQYVSLLAGAADIVGVDLAASTSPLLQ